MGRAKIAAKNSGASLATLIVSYTLQFLYRTVLVYVLGVEYSGITGLCQNVIGLFALSELGISWAITYYLYKPLKEQDDENVAAIVFFLKSLYKWVGLFILFAGASVIPFLDSIIKGGEDIQHLQIIFTLFLINSAVSYLFFSYYQILATADRKNYIVFLPQTIGGVITVCSQIIVIYFFHSFVSAVAISVISTISVNYIIRQKVIRLYPYLKKHRSAKLPASLKKEIVKYIKATTLYKVSLTVQTSSTTVIISHYIGLISLGIYANNMLIVDTVRSLILSIINPMVAVIGEISTNTSAQEKIMVYKRLNFLMEWISYFCAICLFSLLTPFVTLWIGIDNTLSLSTLIIICFYFYIEFIVSFSTQFRSACGLNNIGKFRPLLTAILNIVLAILLVNKLGLNGILIALLLSRITTLTWFEPWVVHKYVFKKSVWPYYRSLILNIVFTLVVAILTKYCVNFLWNGSITRFILILLVCLTLPNLIFVIVNYHKSEFRYFLSIIETKISRS